MSENDIARLVEAVREANRESNKPMENKIVWASVGVIFTIIGACFFLGGQSRDVDNLKKWQGEVSPIIATSTTQIEVIKAVLKIK